MESKKKISDGVKVGLIALLINIVTVGVYVYQTNLMQKQQYAAVWPHLEWRKSFIQGEGLKIVISNNGTGPALIRNVRMSVEGIHQANLDSVLVQLIGTRQIPHISDVVDNRVIPAGGHINLLSVTDPLLSEKLFYDFEKKQFRMQICYESIYEEQWISLGLEVKPGKCY